MHYYQHHIGDFIRDTANLNDHQLATYLRLIWAYYDSESPITGDFEDIAFAMRSDEKTIQLLLRHYFIQSDQGWVHQRCERELQNYRNKSEKAKTSANARWSNAKAMRPHTERNASAKENDANQEPITNNQERESADKPLPPRGRKKSEAKTLAVYIEECRLAKVKPIPAEHSIRRWAEQAGLQADMLPIAWLEFRQRYTEGEKGSGKRYKDWPGHFATAVKDNWFKLWFFSEGEMNWTSVGLAKRAVLDINQKQREVENAAA